MDQYAPMLNALRTLAVVLLLAGAFAAEAHADTADEPETGDALVPPPSPRAEDPPASPTAGEERVDAGALVAAGRFEEAIMVLRPLLAQQEVEPNAIFLYGLASVEASQRPDRTDEEREILLNEAIAAFHAMLIQAPGLVRVRLELARAFYLKGEDDLARRHFEAVLAGGVPDEVAANVNRFLAEIRGRGRWSFNLGAALAPDSNLGGTSDERTIYIYNLPFQRDQQELTTSGIGVSVWGGAEYQVALRESLRLRAGADAARREYEGSLFDQFYLAGHLGPRWLVDRSTDVSLLASAQQRWLGTVPDHRALGVRLEAGHRVSPRVTLSGRASWHGRRYRTRTSQDGPVWDASLAGAYTVMPTVRAEASAGYGRERPDRERDRSRSRWVGAGVSVILPAGFTVGGGGEYRWTDFGEGWFPYVEDGGAREDETWSVRANVHNRGLTLMGFSPELVVVHEERESNAQLHGYDRTRGELRVVRQF